MSYGKKSLENRATLDEVLKFCNKVRLAGGGEILHELLPSVPRRGEACLIARNLNFNCKVVPTHYEHGVMTWEMVIHNDRDLAYKIAEAIECPVTYSGYSRTYIRLPERIGNVAAAFDAASDKSFEGNPTYPALYNEYRDLISYDIEFEGE